MAKGKANAKARGLQLNVEGLFKLLGGTPDDRLKFFEIFKGITSRGEQRLMTAQFETLQTLVNQVQTQTKALKDTASQIAKG